MKEFLKKTILTGLVFFLLLEIVSRVALDPWFYNSLNTYNDKSDGSIRNVYFGEETAHVDYLFIGSSRIPTLIDPQLMKKLSDGKVVVNAGRGRMTPGIHYQALVSKLKKFPDYLKDAIVFIEYTNSQTFSDPFEDDYMLVYEPLLEKDRPMPQLLIPHLDRSSLLSYLEKSKNSRAVKIDVCFLYALSTYRTSEYLNERFNAKDQPLFHSKGNKMVSEGGIRNDKLEELRQKALISSKLNRQKIIDAPLLTDKNMDVSSFAKLHSIITENGGTLVLFNVPIPTNQRNIYSTEKARKNAIVFKNWIDQKGIRVLSVQNFKYTDNDFPDYWHLGKNRRAEFTTALYKEIRELPQNRQVTE